MTLKITLTVDQDHGAELVGLLAKAFGRGELGVSDLRIERIHEPQYRATGKIQRMVEAAAAKVTAVVHERRDYLKRGSGGIIALIVVRDNPPNINAAVKAAYVEAGLSPDGAGATLSKLKARGFIKRSGVGKWALTEKGEARLNNEGEHDGANRE